VVNILPGWVDTEGLDDTLTDDTARTVMKDFGFDLDDVRKNRDKMLRGEDVAEAVWSVVTKPDNVYIEDVLIRDSLQHM